jgi:hypothetical protein
MQYRRVSHLAWRRVLDEMVVLDLRNRRMLALDGAGGRLFERLAAPASLEDLGRQLWGDASDGGGELRPFVDELLALGVLEVDGDVPAAPAGERVAAAAGGTGAAGAALPRVLWSETLHAVNQCSPPFCPGDPPCDLAGMAQEKARP